MFLLWVNCGDIAARLSGITITIVSIIYIPKKLTTSTKPKYQTQLKQNRNEQKVGKITLREILIDKSLDLLTISTRVYFIFGDTTRGINRVALLRNSFFFINIHSSRGFHVFDGRGVPVVARRIDDDI